MYESLKAQGVTESPYKSLQEQGGRVSLYKSLHIIKGKPCVTLAQTCSSHGPQSGSVQTQGDSVPFIVQAASVQSVC